MRPAERMLPFVCRWSAECQVDMGVTVFPLQICTCYIYCPDAARRHLTFTPGIKPSNAYCTNQAQVADKSLHVLVFPDPRHKCFHLPRRQHPRMSATEKRHL